MQSHFLSFLIIISLFVLSCTNVIDSEEEEYFIFVLYGELSVSNISDVVQELEDNYQRILKDLQVGNMPLITVKIWDDYDHFAEVLETEFGVSANGTLGYISSKHEFRLYFTNQSPLHAVHEFSHLVPMQLTDSFPNNPRWLWEAVALYESRDFIDPKTLPYMVSGEYPTLEVLNSDFGSSNSNYIYEVGYVLLEYIVQTWGMDTVIGLIKNRGNISKILEIPVQKFESGWYKFVEDKYLNPYLGKKMSGLKPLTFSKNLF